MRKRYRIALLTAALAVLAGAVALSARGVEHTVGTDDVAKPDPAGDVTAKGLTARERAAIDIVRVEAFGDAFATVVTVTFAGNFEGAFGRGRLASAFAGVVLRLARGQPTVVATRGPGVGEFAGGLGGRGPFAVLRQGRTVTFVARRFDFTKFSRIEVKTFAALGPPRRTTQNASQTPRPFDPYLPAIASKPAQDSWTTGTPPSGPATARSSASVWRC